MLRKSFSALKHFPVHFLLLQLPEVAVSVLSDMLPSDKPIDLAVSFGVLFPCLCIASMLSAALTCASVISISKGDRPRLRDTLHSVFQKWTTLVPVSLLAGMLFLLGLGILIVPGLYFMTIYFFAAQSVIYEEKQPWTLYFLRSKRLVHGRFLFIAAAVIIILVLSFAVELIPFTGISNAASAIALGYALKLLVSATSSAVANLWAAHMYLKLRSVSI